MIITVAQYKGGVAKTTSAVHIATYLNQLAPTLLIDSDPNRNALGWARRGGEKFPLKVVSDTQSPRLIPQYRHIVIDTKARTDRSDLPDIVEGCDLLILPVTPAPMDFETLLEVIDDLQTLKADPTRYKVLITKIPPRPARDGELLREQLAEDGIPHFETMVRFYKAFSKAAGEGVPVYDVSDPKAKDGWEDYSNVCKEVVLDGNTK
jgi:chromosome partitioning protein